VWFLIYETAPMMMMMMIPAADVVAVAVVIAAAAVVVDVAADQFSTPFVHTTAIRWFD